MQIKETPDVSFPGAVESPPLEDAAVLASSAGVSFGVQPAFSASVHDDSSGGVVASRCVEIPLVGGDGEISGVLCRSAPRSDTRDVLSSRGPKEVRAIGGVAHFMVHDINNLFAVIDSGLRLLECQSDAAYRKPIISKMRDAITRGALLSRQLLDNAARPCPESTGGFVSGGRLAALAGTLDRMSRPDVTVRTKIAPDLWDFNADPEELYFALLNLCRNSADAMPVGGVITVAARNAELSSGAARRFVEFIVADEGEGMPEEFLSRAFTPYFSTKAAGSGKGLGLPHVQRFAEGRGGAVSIESKQGEGTSVRLFLPRMHAAGLPSSIVAAEIAYTPSPDGGVFHVVNPGTAAPTS